MDDMVDRSLVVRANNNLILLSDEVWTFGPIADGVYAEIQLANSLGKPDCLNLSYQKGYAL